VRKKQAACFGAQKIPTCIFDKNNRKRTM